MKYLLLLFAKQPIKPKYKTKGEIRQEKLITYAAKILEQYKILN